MTQSELGTVQGGSISPLLANIYLHYAFDLWVKWPMWPFPKAASLPFSRGNRL